ncbi:Acyl-coenzyme A dehydrogenase [compost metagenome]
MDVHGGKGIIMGPNNYLGRNWQGAPIFITVEGANILSRNLMIFGQGAIRCHPFVLKEMALAGLKDQDQALRAFDDLLIKHIMFAAGNASSTLIHGLGLSRLETVPGDALSQSYFRALNRQAAAFALLADLSMLLLGGTLKRRERLSARLGDVLSYLYLASAALKRYHDLGSPEHIKPLLRWAMEESLGQAEKALDRLLDNFPNRFVGCALRVLVFPLGRRHTGPSDELDAEVAGLIGRSKGDPALEELLAGCFRPSAEGDPVATLQTASDLMAETAPQARELQQAMRAGKLRVAAGEGPVEAAVRAGILHPAQARRLEEAEHHRRQVIEVDAFDKESLALTKGKIR